ncbi:hypothetical protein DFH09DRAFT_1031684 [Mycena vulgaris]|nr:hypothetical protein DFH09DRAFT_1031684 [Mycena vulgaris]
MAGAPPAAAFALNVLLLRELSLPFPSEARGFFYYRSHLPLEGSLRFRCTSDTSSSSFPRGQDLLATSGFPWRITLAQIAYNRSYAWITRQLVHENLVTQEELGHCHRVFSRSPSAAPHLTLFRLDSTFLLNFSRQLALTVVGDALHKLSLPALCSDGDGDGDGVPRFEASTLPEHSGRRVLHVRVVKIIQPVACTRPSHTGRVVRPQEGQLLTVCNHGGPAKPWAYNIDKRSSVAAAALRVLWDNSPPP